MISLESYILQFEHLPDDSIEVLLLIVNRGKSKFSTTHVFEIKMFDGCDGDDI